MAGTSVRASRRESDSGLLHGQPSMPPHFPAAPPRSRRSRRACCRTPTRRGRSRARRRRPSADARNDGRSAPRRLPGRAAWPGRARARPRPGSEITAALSRRRADDAQALDLLAARSVACASSACSRASMFVHAERLQVVDRGAQADDAGDVRRAGLELVRRIVEDGACRSGLRGSSRRRRGRAASPARCSRRAHSAPVPVGPQHLVAGEGIEIAADARRCRPAGAARPASRRPR